MYRLAIYNLINTITTNGCITLNMKKGKEKGGKISYLSLCSFYVCFCHLALHSTQSAQLIVKTKLLLCSSHQPWEWKVWLTRKFVMPTSTRQSVVPLLVLPWCGGSLTLKRFFVLTYLFYRNDSLQNLHLNASLWNQKGFFYFVALHKEPFLLSLFV